MRPIVQPLLNDINGIAETDITASWQGWLVIGATAMIAEIILPRLCVEFMSLYPGVQMVVESLAVTDLLDRLSRFEIETAMVEIHLAADEVEPTRWRTDELVLVVSADHPLAKRGTLRIADLAGYGWCMREALSAAAARLRYMLHRELGQVPVVFEATSNWSVRHAVMAGGGIGWLPTSIVQFDLDNGRLVRLDVEDVHFTGSISIARLKGVWRSRIARAFDAFLPEHGDGP